MITNYLFRKLDAMKYVVILIYRKESPVTPISTLTMKLKISEGTSPIERFGCKIKNDQFEETLSEDEMGAIYHLLHPLIHFHRTQQVFYS